MSAALFCKLAGHQFTAWQYIAPNSCTQNLICARCHAIGDTRTLHQWSSLKAENIEFHSRTCLRCAEQERQAHILVAGVPCPVCDGTGQIAITGVMGFDPSRLPPSAETAAAEACLVRLHPLRVYPVVGSLPVRHRKALPIPERLGVGVQF